MTASVLHLLHAARAPAEHALPFSRESATVALLAGLIVFAVIAYDAYRVHVR